MKKTIKHFCLATLTLLAFASCKKNKSNDPKPETPLEVGGGEAENITRVVLFLSNGTNKDTVIFNDPKGNGTNVTVDSLVLKANVTYSVIVKIYDDTKNPIELVSDEILKEANYHRFHYTFSAITGNPSISTTILDKDSQTPTQPLGLTFDLKPGAGFGKGAFKVSLRHFAEGIDKTENPNDGQQDLSVEFPTRIF